MHRHEQRVTARHATQHRSRRGRAATVVAVAVAFTAAAATIAAGPVSAHEAASPAQAVRASGTVPGTQPLPVDSEDAFGRMLADAQRRTADAQRAERAQIIQERKERRERLAKRQARRLAAKVRASRAALRSTIVRPVAGGYRLTARFDDGGSLWGSGRHTGLDFACAVGTPVHVVADGVVVSAGYDGAYGNRVEVRHADGTVTTYNHMSAIAVRGGSVHAGEVIGRVGATGNTTGAHLHFEVMRGGEYVDPETWLRAHYVSY